jgi:hypothetical protein
MLNINLTYGMALAIKRIQTRATQTQKQWKDENKVEEHKKKMKDQILSRKVNIKHLARGMGLDVKKSESESRLSTSRKSIFETLGDEEDELSDGFYFESWLGKRLTIKLENYDRWIASEISLSIEHQLSAVVEFAEWEDYGEHQFRKLKALKNVIKAVQKFVHQGKITENLEENLL